MMKALRIGLAVIIGIGVGGSVTAGPGQHSGRTAGITRPGITADPVVIGKLGPMDYGQGSSVSTFHALAFRPFDNSFDFSAGVVSSGWAISPTSLSAGFATGFAANLQVPEGAQLDLVRLQVCNASGAAPPLVFGIATLLTDIVDVGIPAFLGCEFVSSPALSHVVTENAGAGLALFVNWLGGPTDGTVYIASGEVWWHRSVSPSPAQASFLDVPTTDPRFQFIEAIYGAGITAGCGANNYCPDAPLTRGQMAVFLAKALGIYWPNTP